MKITDAQLKEIYAHAKETYPYECCGFLIGQFEQEGLVRQVRRATNQNTERTDRFVINPQEYMQAQFEAEDAGLDIIGFYHSHPDWPAIPSQTDIDNAAWDYFYVIASIHEGMPLNTNVWRLADEGLRLFEWVALEIVDANAL
jgi:proteasome lid subunit RPN8/RPN11